MVTFVLTCCHAPRKDPVLQDLSQAIDFHSPNIHRGTLKLTLRRKKIILQKIIFTICIISTMKVLIVSLLVCALMALTTAAAVPEAEPGQKIEPLVQEGKSHIVERSSSCPRGWTRYSGRCFLYVPTAMTWSNAERNCQSLGGNLASVHNVQEYQEIQRLIVKTTFESKETWIGGSDAQQDSIWLWSDGSHFIHVNWCRGLPDNYQGRQHCLQMNYGEGKCCDDVECFTLRPFVCSKKI
ncbi:galactose-specific lectin nattectin-like isoform X2 [Perca fluviatilis]|uniref:galactose-specific lectin nattectin-like isoform X2 n=1 Tax=Perca fluviatilis TaxID=8168 RepID=UPI0019652B9F|nr:galactose-specific lectin nattectin-like isoform X2 [Perca fluviatilis]XP_039678904.1 galactose-specific lectin nattectin-like isoform X2 [Perca fluviatilis]